MGEILDFKSRDSIEFDKKLEMVLKYLSVESAKFKRDFKKNTLCVFKTREGFIRVEQGWDFRRTWYFPLMPKITLVAYKLPLEKPMNDHLEFRLEKIQGNYAYYEQI